MKDTACLAYLKDAERRSASMPKIPVDSLFIGFRTCRRKLSSSFSLQRISRQTSSEMAVQNGTPQKIPRPVVLSGPSGCGKSTLITRLMSEVGKDKIGFSVSHTTRQPRPGEINGVHYHFVTEGDFLKIKEENGFVETAIFSGNRYGTSKMAVRSLLNAGKLCLLDIDMQGVKSLKESDLNAVYIFIKPPSLATLEQRLRSRGTETEEAIQKRLSAAGAEMAYAETPGAYDCTIVNDDLETAYSELKSIIQRVMDENQACCP